MSKTAFLKLRIKIPDIAEQTKIANVLSVIDTKIETEKEYLKLLVSQNSWLLKKLFT
jgi:type I restriction enzyme S subunit